MTATGYLRIIAVAIFSGGVTAGFLLDKGLAWWVVGVLGISGAALYLPACRKWRLKPGLALFCLTGALALAGYSLWDQASLRRDPAGYHWLVRTVTGRVAQVQKGKERLRLTLELEEAELIDGKKVPLAGDIVVYANEEEGKTIRVHSLLKVGGDLVPLPREGKFARFWGYLTERGVRGVIMRSESLAVLEGPQAWRRALGSLRASCDSWFSYLGQSGSSFMQALVFGDRSGLTREEKGDFAAAGIIHVMAVSGMHIAVASSVLLALLGLIGVGKRLAWPLVLILLVVYAGLCNWTPSVMRAICMLSWVGVCKYFRASVPVLDVLLLAGLTLFIEDRDVISQPGFLLSFFATAGIILFARPLTGALRWLRLPGWLANSLAVSLAAQLAVAPLLTMFFSQISLVAPLANCVFVPLILFFQVLGMILPFFALLGADELVRSLFQTILDGLFALIHEAASLPWAVVETGTFPWWGVLAYTCLVFAVIKGAERVIQKRRKDRKLAFATQVTGFFTRERFDGQTRTGTEFSCQSTGTRTPYHASKDQARGRCA